MIELASLQRSDRTEIAATTPAEPPAHLEIGIIYTGRQTDSDFQTVRTVKERFAGRLASVFPEVCWSLTLHRREFRSAESKIEPADLLQFGSDERDAREWDSP